MGCGLMWRNDVPKTVVLMQIGALGVALVFMVIASSMTQSFNLHRTRTHPDTPEDHISLCVLSAGVLILYTAIEGQAANGVSRWLSIGGTGISIQPSVMLMPAMLIAAAILRNALATIGVALAFLGLAFQGDALLAFASLCAAVLRRSTPKCGDAPSSRTRRSGVAIGICMDTFRRLRSTGDGDLHNISPAEKFGPSHPQQHFRADTRHCVGHADRCIGARTTGNTATALELWRQRNHRLLLESGAHRRAPA
jgi:hypothetical protein